MIRSPHAVNFPRNVFFVQLSEAEMFDDFALFIVENPGPGGEMVCVCGGGLLTTLLFQYREEKPRRCQF